jgi:tricorn protease-like protein/C-terminal processing protease CtpA/Prc
LNHRSSSFGSVGAKKSTFRPLALLACCGLPLAAMAEAPTQPQAAQVSPNAAMLRWPDVSATHIVFSYANDLWVVPKAGGQASPLASPPGAENFPRFSPDGSTISFVGNYDGGRDLYTIGVTGGIPNRVTYHPSGELLCDWTPDGKGLHFLTNGLAGLGRQTQAFTVPVEGGAYSALPVPYSGFGSISPSGEWLAYTPHSTDTRTWKRYRGGMATDIWLYNLKTNAARQITDWEGTDTLPMWVPGGDGSVVYYLSDNGPEHRLNIWSFDVKSGARTQVTTFKDDDVRWPSVGPGGDGKGEIVFQLGAKLMLLNLGTKQSAEVKVTVPGARPKLRTRTVDAAGYISGASIGPGAKRVVIEARGDLFTAPVKEGYIRALTRTDGVAERDPSWSPDGKWIAYFSDESGENELYLRPSDARPPEEKKDEKKDDKKAEAKDEVTKDDAPEAKPAKVEPRKISSLGAGFRSNPQWSPDSKHIACTDQNGRLYLASANDDGVWSELKEIDKDPWMGGIGVSWSSDSKWIAYRRGDEKTNVGVIWIMDVKTGEKHRVTAGMFDASAPAFDRKGDFLFYRSQMAVDNPVYSDLDTTYAYNNSEVILMAPLRKDVKSPGLESNDEERYKKDEKKKEEKKDDKKDEAKPSDAKPADAKPAETKAAADDGVSGTWTGTVKGSIPELAGGLPLTLNLSLEGEKVSGSISTVMGGGSISGTFNKTTGELSLEFDVNGAKISMKGTISGADAKGTWSGAGPGGNPMTGDWNATRSKAADKGGAADKEEKKDEKKDDAKEVKIDFDGLEARSIRLDIAPGSFGWMAVADGDKLVYTRTSSRGGARESGLKIYDYKADEPKEEAITGGGGWQLTPDGKKILIVRGSSISIVDASAGGGKAQTVSTAGMTMTIDPRDEWNQIFTDAWRIMRDWYYEPTMHGVDWPAMKKHYGAMVADAASREDVNWIISEMISELNVGHAYLNGPGDVEQQPSGGQAGMLGADFTLDTTVTPPAYKISRIIGGGPWDADARGPLSEPGVDAKVGDYILAVNGIPVDVTKDIYASFLGMQGKIVALTLNASPTMDGKEREVIVQAIGSESNLRYRAWIEGKRAYVEEKSGGKIGYIYVPNTGVDGQNDLYRQYFGQRGKDALIIDERWNGGGQIPTRFIELLNRPATNYWARRDGNDWPWPPDAFFGHKAMLVNGLAGSGGDMFPWLFKHNKLGPVIGTRTWGGLVGISGNAQMIDGGSISAPTFGFYETDGTWGVEGHGTDPDIVVVDDPSKMVGGADPQLDRAIEEMMNAIKTNPYVPPKRPASPTYRKGMGIEEKDK